MGVPAMCASANILDSTHIYDDGDVPYGSLYFLTTINHQRSKHRSCHGDALNIQDTELCTIKNNVIYY